MTGNMDFTPKPAGEFSAVMQSLIDKAMQAENQSRPRRNYLGASRVGEACMRKLAYEYLAFPKDEGREFKGTTLRIFDMGHDGEERQAQYLRLSGFDLITHKADGGQIGFAVAWDEEAKAFRFSGHIDGVIVKAPYESGVVCPALWEAKSLGAKSFADVLRKGVEVSKPVYYAQMQLYMAYLDLGANPGLFSAINRDTGEMYFERVPFNAAAAQAASDKGVKVVQSRHPEELPRVAKVSTDSRCKFCDFPQRCWAEPAAAEPVTSGAWSWGQ